ncbi:MAG: 8-amino-7-oxononanoate synthase, partial [Gemmataceae bacterium]
GGRELINFSSNDYLSLAGDARLARAAAAAAKRYGCGAGASPLISGYSPPLRALERDLADWEEAEAVLVFASGHAANVALPDALVGRGDAVFSDALNHASLIDGCRLSRAAVHVYRHNDAAHLADLLHQEGRNASRRLIVSDSVFSMDGDAAPLPQLVELADRYDCLLLIDEAHATGVLGAHGRGLTDDLPPASWSWDRLIKVGTLSKALGTQGGFVCGSRRLIDWLVNRARPYIFSTALAPPIAAAARRAVEVARQEPQRRQRVVALAEQLRRQLRELGGNVGASRGPIVPFIVGSVRETMALSHRLQQQGLLAPAIRPPSVPEGSARLRLSVTADHGEADVARLVDALRANVFSRYN